MVAERYFIRLKLGAEMETNEKTVFDRENPQVLTLDSSLSL